MALGTEFGAAAEDYEAGRPEYPAEAVGWMLEGTSGAVLDLGAGTGKLTRGLVALGREVVAVDPDAAMLERLSAALPGVATHIGVAEEVPLPGASVGAVVLGQAWHWVDVAQASREVARVLAPGGALGLVWNVRDSRVSWVADLGHAMHESAAEQLIDDGGPDVGAPFGAIEELRLEWSRPMTRDQIEAMVRSRSYYIAAGAEGRADVDARVASVLEALPQVASGGAVDLPYITAAFRTRRP